MQRIYHPSSFPNNFQRRAAQTDRTPVAAFEDYDKLMNKQHNYDYDQEQKQKQDKKQNYNILNYSNNNNTNNINSLNNSQNLTRQISVLSLKQKSLTNYSYKQNQQNQYQRQHQQFIKNNMTKSNNINIRKQKEFLCKNNDNRPITHYIVDDNGIECINQKYCEKCSIMLASKGYNVVKIKKNQQKSNSKNNKDKQMIKINKNKSLRQIKYNNNNSIKNSVNMNMNKSTSSISLNTRKSKLYKNCNLSASHQPQPNPTNPYRQTQISSLLSFISSSLIPSLYKSSSHLSSSIRSSQHQFTTILTSTTQYFQYLESFIELQKYIIYNNILKLRAEYEEPLRKQKNTLKKQQMM